MCHSVVDKHSVEVFHVGETDKFVDGGIIAEIAFMPMALVDTTHFVGDMVKAFSPASFLTPRIRWG